MTEPGDREGWRLRIRAEADGRILGSGFLVAPDLALTCAHVVAGGDRVRVRPAGPDQPEYAGRVVAVPEGADVAVVDVSGLRGRVPSAPLASLDPVLPGTLLRAYGHADKHGATGAWTEAVARGADLSGECVQVELHGPRGVAVRPGFSGGPVVDAATGRVVGMSRSAEPDQGNAWVLPLGTIARHWPRLRTLVPDPLDIDPDHRRGQDALAVGDYPTAARALAAVAERHPRAPVLYRLALARLAGRSPRALLTGQLADIERLVRRALCTNPEYAPAAALLAVLKEEVRQSLDLADDPPYLPELHDRAMYCSREELTELRTHCPAAAGTVTWYLLIGRKHRAS